MSRVLAALVLALLFLGGTIGGATAAPATQTQPDQYTLPGNTVFPEGIAYDHEGHGFFVGSSTDGTIYRASVNDATAQVFLPGGQDGRKAVTGMKVDTRGRLYVCGAGTGLFFVYDIATRALLAKFDTGAEPKTFLNDVTLTPSGDAYFTDSVSPYLYRVYTDAQGKLAYERWLDFTGTALVYGQGFNANGIAASDDGQYLIVVQTNTGKLYRITVATKQVTEINAGTETFTFGDGILLTGHILHVMRNQLALLASVQLSTDYATGQVISAFTSPLWHYPTTFAVADGRVFAVNSQFDKQNPPQPQLPFTVASVPLPAAATGGQTPGMPTTGQAGNTALLWAALAAVALLSGLALRARKAW